MKKTGNIWEYKVDINATMPFRLSCVAEWVRTVHLEVHRSPVESPQTFSLQEKYFYSIRRIHNTKFGENANVLRRENLNSGKTEERNRKPMQCSLPNVKKHTRYPRKQNERQMMGSSKVPSVVFAEDDALLYNIIYHVSFTR